MKIIVKSRDWIKRKLEKDLLFYTKANFISIFSKDSYSPFPDRFNVLKLNFDDVTEVDKNESDANQLLFFNEDIANQIVNFINSINKERILFVHCDAGISRSGAVGYVLNEYLNKYLENNEEDDRYFKIENPGIAPNSLVVQILKPKLFGVTDYSVLFSEITFNEDGESLIEHKEI